MAFTTRFNLVLVWPQIVQILTKKSSNWVRHNQVSWSSFHTNNPVNQAANKSQGLYQMECYDCGARFTNREELMTHKKKQHWKQKPCVYYWSEGAGCRYPDRVCYNIHGQEESQGQVTSRQEVRRQVGGGQVSWAGAARSRGQG